MVPKYNLGDLVIFENNSYVVSGVHFADQFYDPFMYKLTSVETGNTVIAREKLITLDTAYEGSKSRRLSTDKE